MSTEIRPAHSPLGASSAERWMNCPGSVALLKELKLPESDEPDYRTAGIAAHRIVESCLKADLDAWEFLGHKEEITGRIIDDEIVNAVQFYVDEIRGYLEPWEGDVPRRYFEYPVDAPEFHHQFYGTLDCGLVFEDHKHMVIRDYKHGEGIAVDVEWNPQIMYYAYGLLRHHPEVATVDLGIVQPRGFHPDGPIRSWACSADTIRSWARDVLKAAMDRTEMDKTLDAGPWCRFCPAKLVCPLMTSLFGAACTADPKLIVNLSDESLGRSYQYTQAVKFYLKAMEDETFRRLNTGAAVPGTKLVMKKANRVYKEGAEGNLVNLLGPADVYTKPELKSPAEMEKVSAEAKKLVREWAYTPMTGLTVALETDKRAAVKVTTSAEAFAHAPGVEDAGT